MAPLQSHLFHSCPRIFPCGADRFLHNSSWMIGLANRFPRALGAVQRRSNALAPYCPLG